MCTRIVSVLSLLGLVLGSGSSSALAKGPDTKSPQLTISTPAKGKAGYQSSMSVVVSGSSNEILSYAKANGQSLQLGANRTSFSGTILASTDGPLAIHFEGADVAGNIGTEDRSINIDSAVPTIALGILDNALTNKRSFSFSITVSDSSPTTTIVLLNGTEVHRGTKASFNVSENLIPGANVFQISSIDAAGNAAEPATLSNIVLDNIDPIISNLSPLPNAIVGPSFVVSGTSNEDLSSATVNGTNLQISQDHRSFSGVYSSSPGNLTLRVSATDMAGNIATNNVRVNVDGSLPVLSNILPLPSSTIGTLVVPVSGQCSQALSSATANGQSLTLSADLKSFSGNFVAQSDGSTIIQIVATDLSGRTATANIPVFFDHLPPVVNLGVTDHYLTNNPDWSLPISVLDSSATSVVVFQNGTQVFQSVEPFFALPIQLIEGPNTFKVTVTDVVGNQAPDIELFDIVLDTHVPTLSQLTPSPNAYISTHQIALHGSSDEPLSIVTVNNQVLALSSDGLSFSGSIIAPSEGLIRLNWLVTDRAGNVAEKRYSVTVDTVKPLVTTRVQAASFATNDKNFVFPFTVEDNSGTTTKVYLNDEEVFALTNASLSLDNFSASGAANITVHAQSGGAPRTIDILSLNQQPGYHLTSITPARRGDASVTQDGMIQYVPNSNKSFAAARALRGINGAQANGESYPYNFTADGRYLIFDSFASNLVDGDTNEAWDAFVLDATTGAISRLFMRSDGVQPDGDTFATRISSDGRYVSAQSYATNLVPGQSNPHSGVYLFDRLTNSIQLLSVAHDGSVANNASNNPFISWDGKSLVFVSRASNLVTNDTNDKQDIFVRDLVANSTELISVSSDGIQGNEDSDDIDISRDGRFIVFSGLSDNLVPNDTIGFWDVFIRDRQLNKTTRVSVAPDGTDGNDWSLYTFLSENGRYVFFESWATNLVPGTSAYVLNSFRYDQETRKTTLLVTGYGGEEVNSEVAGYFISNDGRYYSFITAATNILPDNVGGNNHCYVKDLYTGQTVRVSALSDGGEMNAACARIGVSPDNTTAVLVTAATNLVLGDNNGTSDIYLMSKNDEFDYVLSDDFGHTKTGRISIREPVTGPLSRNTNSVVLALRNGENVIRTTAVDAAGNAVESDVLNHITLDTAPPLLSGLIPSLTITSNSVNVSGSSNEPLTAASLNGQTLTISEDGLSFTGLYEIDPLAPNGPIHLHWVATDSAGNNAAIDSEIQLDIVHQGPIIQLGFQDHFISNHAGIQIPVTVIDITEVSCVANQNGSQVFATNGMFWTLFTQLSEGMNFFQFICVNAFGVQSEVFLSDVILDTTLPLLSSILPSGGNVSSVFTISGTSNERLSAATANGQPLLISQDQLAFSGSYNATSPGPQNISIQITDLAGNSSWGTANANVTFTASQPTITLGVQDHYKTKNSVWDIPVSVNSVTARATQVFQNGVLIANSTEPFFNVSVTLREGSNFFEARVRTADGGEATAGLYDIVLDTMPPVLSLSPGDGSIVALSFGVAGTSTEPLSGISVNGQPLTLSADHKGFSGTYSAPADGQLNLQWVATDVIGNTMTRNIAVTVTTTILNPNLLSVAPSPDGNHLLIIGAVGATRPGIAVKARASLFNSGSTTAGQDGSFSILMSPFSSAVVMVTDPNSGQTASAQVQFNGDTKLAGTVKDTSGNALPGVTVSLIGNAATAITDSTGTFAFQQNIPTGDQTLVIDGRTVPQNLFSPQRRFSVTRASISIGISQSNVLQRPIYLAPITLDGSATTISVAAGGAVTSAQAPGVSLDIPPGATKFPDGATSGPISMATISSQFSSVPPLDFAVPTNVVSLEPSGLSFSEPVRLTLPNVNELPPGVELIIMSMNSTKGIWEMDGAAKVSEDGQSVITKDGAGITHFSTIYAVPLGPMVRETGQQDRPGADAFNGAFSTGVTMPSYKSMGQDIAPGLIYKSTWAHPTALVSNILDVPEQKTEVGYVTQTGGQIVYNWQTLSKCGGSFWDRHCSWDNNYFYDYLHVRESANISSWYVPEKVTAQFFTTGLAGDLLTFNGPPNKATISYSLDLKDPASGQFMDSGVYPYSSKYRLYLKQMVLSTRSFTSWTNLRPAPVYSQMTSFETRQLEQAFPSDVNGLIYVQNKVNSAAGRGWRIAGFQKIVNPTSSRLLLEEADGGISGYAVNNTITTLFDANNTQVDLTQGVDLFNWPNATVTTWDSESRTGFSQIDLSAPNPLAIDRGTVVNNGGFIAHQIGSSCDLHPFQKRRKIKHTLQMPGGAILGTDSGGHALVQLSGTSFSTLAGIVQTATSNSLGTPEGVLLDRCKADPDSGTMSFGIPCPSTGPIDCSTIHQYTGAFSLPGQAGGGAGIVDPATCQTDPYLPNVGACVFCRLNGQCDTGSAMNSPRGIAPGPGNYIIIADTGNNAVRIYDTVKKSIGIVAGNQQTFDSGDGLPARQASIFHPRAAIYDAAGNLYISTERGFIRKVDTTGVISTFAGRTLEQGGTLADTAPASEFVFNQPYGLAVDNQNGYLYVADTGSHRVIRIDFLTRTATTVAGTSSVGYNGDNQAALNANLSSPTFIGLDDQNNLLIADSENHRIRKVTFNNAQGGVLAFSPAAFDHTTLTRNADGTWVRKYRNGAQVFFDSSGNQVSSLDRVGRTTAMAYDDAGNLTAYTDSSGRTTSYQYSGGRLSNITDPVGRTTSFGFSGEYLVSVRFPDGGQKAYSYDEHGLMIGETNQRGFTTSYAYNAFHRIQQVTRPDGSTITINDTGSATASNSYTGGAVGQLRSVGPDADQVYDGIKDSRNIETKFVKDFQGLVTMVTDASGQITKIYRDQRGKPTLIARPDGTQVTYNYDPNTDDLLSQTDSALGITKSHTYDSFGATTSTTNGRNFTNFSSYDPVTGLLTSSMDPLGHVTSYTYYPNGQLASVRNFRGEATSYTYDIFGNKNSIRDPQGHTLAGTRDLAGNVISLTNANNQTSLYEFDSWNRVRALVTAKNERTEYSYLPTGALSQVKDPLSNISTYSYDSIGRQTSFVDQLGFIFTKAYDANGNLIQTIDPNGNTTSFTYNSLNQLTQKVLGDDVFVFQYNVRGHPTYIANHNSEVLLNYDVGGRLLSTQSKGLGVNNGLPSMTLAYTYDQNGNRLTLTDLAGTTTYGYDALDRLISLTNPKSENYSFTIDDPGNRVAISRPGSQTTQSFDSLGQISAIAHSSSGGLPNYDYQWDSIGNLKQLTSSTGGLKQLGYDNDNQITSANNSEASLETFSYDQIHNRVSDQGGSYNYDIKAQRLIQDYKYFYFYDANGNLISKQAKGMTGEVTNFTYSSLNQLLSMQVFLPGNSSPIKEAFYTYDALGRRVQSRVIDSVNPNDQMHTFTRRYAYDGTDLLFEFDGSNQIIARYTNTSQAADGVLAVDITQAGVNHGLAQNARSYMYLRDSLGSVVDIADSAGNLIQHVVYSTFGQIVAIRSAQGADITQHPILATRRAFIGREFDPETGFYLMGARYYDPAIGRFLQKDPAPGKVTLAVSVNNSYVYAGNNPTNIKDPTGLSFWGSTLGRIVIGIAIAAAIYVTAGAASSAVVAAAGLGGTAGGVILGAAVGALVGGLVGGTLTQLFGVGSFGQGFMQGAIAGALVGAVAGYNATTSSTSVSGIQQDGTSEYLYEVSPASPPSTGSAEGSIAALDGHDPGVNPFSEIDKLNNFATQGHRIGIMAEGPGVISILGTSACTALAETVDVSSNFLEGPTAALAGIVIGFSLATMALGCSY